MEVADFISTIIEYAPKFIPGAGRTIILSFMAIVCGTIFGVLLSILKLSKKRLFVAITDVYLLVVRGTPLLLQLLFIFYGLPQVGLDISAFWSAVIGLALHNAAYICEIFRGAIESIDKGQAEASYALGMTNFQCFKNVILPQAIKNAIPPLGNQFIIALKDSSLASTITIVELIMLSKQYVSATYNVFPIFFTAGCYYLIITVGISKLLNIVELRLKVSER